MGNLLSGQQFGSTGSLASASDTDQVCIFHCQVHQKYRKRQIKFDFVCEKKSYREYGTIVWSWSVYSNIKYLKDGQQYQF